MDLMSQRVPVFTLIRDTKYPDANAEERYPKRHQLPQRAKNLTKKL